MLNQIEKLYFSSSRPTLKYIEGVEHLWKFVIKTLEEQ